MQNDFTAFVAAVPGSRVIFGDLLSFFVNFDRLQFYYYHSRAYGYYARLILANVNLLNSLKGSLFSNTLA